ncbi:MAG: hypothetical protein KDK12_00735 [Rhodobacteraceae bacterium]|nr:hypothetical protein [Paracoccaceae bacterium]
MSWKLAQTTALCGLIIGAGNSVQANGVSHSCPPDPVNLFAPMFDPVPVPGLNTELGTFEPWPLEPELAALGFVARRVSDGAFVVIPNELTATLLSWAKISEPDGEVCASRIVAVFESEGQSQAIAPLIEAIRDQEQAATFVRPIMQDVQVEFTIPFIGYMSRFDPRPTFPLGGTIVVWDLDRTNTLVLERFITDGGPSVDLPGALMFTELYTGLFFSILLSIDGDTLLENQFVVAIEY